MYFFINRLLQSLFQFQIRFHNKTDSKMIFFSQILIVIVILSAIESRPAHKHKHHNEITIELGNALNSDSIPVDSNSTPDDLIEFQTRPAHKHRHHRNITDDGSAENQPEHKHRHHRNNLIGGANPMSNNNNEIINMQVEAETPIEAETPAELDSLQAALPPIEAETPTELPPIEAETPTVLDSLQVKIDSHTITKPLIPAPAPADGPKCHKQDHSKGIAPPTKGAIGGMITDVANGVDFGLNDAGCAIGKMADDLASGLVHGDLIGGGMKAGADFMDGLTEFGQVMVSQAADGVGKIVNGVADFLNNM